MLTNLELSGTSTYLVCCEHTETHPMSRHVKNHDFYSLDLIVTHQQRPPFCLQRMWMLRVSLTIV